VSLNASIPIVLDKSTIKAVKEAAKEIKVTPQYLVYNLILGGLVRLDRSYKNGVRFIDRVGNTLDSGRQWAKDLLRERAERARLGQSQGAEGDSHSAP
jgi:hypothetical protein